MNKFRITLLSILCCLGCASAHSATNLGDIIRNMGNIDLHGLPRLSFEIASRQDVGELATLGFGFNLIHRVSLNQGKTARTEWFLPCLQTCAYIDAQGDVIWLTTSGLTVRFQKKERDDASSNNIATVKVLPESNTIEITTRDLTKWRYRNGFLEGMSTRRGDYAVTTDRGTILSISKTILNREICLLECTHSMQGDLGELEFAEGKKYRLHWSANHSLMSIDGPDGRRFDFEYTGSLLTCWKKADGPRNECK